MVLATGDLLTRLKGNLCRVIRGKEAAVDCLLVALLANGHVLMEDVPGVGKTTLAKALARSLQAEFRRIQFTPDLLPTDIVGGMIYSPISGEFSFRPGPVFCNVLLGDEINRASPRTQSALLEAMSERQVTIEGQRHELTRPFIVVATQNPVEYHGTYPLPEAQLDRFAMRIELGYPDEEMEIAVVVDQKSVHPLEGLCAVADVADVVAAQDAVCGIHVEASLVRYITSLVRATRQDARLRLGASPRAALVLFRCCQALALLRGRGYVTPDDVRALAVPVIAHRLVLDTKASYSGTRKDAVVLEILDRVPVPL
jgi:MoxR-like ATPase